jgi:hypothetical protein
MDPYGGKASPGEGHGNQSVNSSVAGPAPERPVVMVVELKGDITLSQGRWLTQVVNFIVSSPARHEVGCFTLAPPYPGSPVDEMCGGGASP